VEKQVFLSIRRPSDDQGACSANRNPLARKREGEALTGLSRTVSRSSAAGWRRVPSTVVQVASYVFTCQVIQPLAVGLAAATGGDDERTGKPAARVARGSGALKMGGRTSSGTPPLGGAATIPCDGRCSPTPRPRLPAYIRKSLLCEHTERSSA
jgi:hypothetical protein